jgi:mono/diheme cytochrome c family protein
VASFAHGGDQTVPTYFSRRWNVAMKMLRVATMRCSLALAIFTLCLHFPSLSFGADDGGSLYKAKCARCHGQNGEGNPAIKAPSLVSDEAKKMSDNEIKNMIAMIANGEHEKNPAQAISKRRLTAHQTSALVIYIRQMQKK